MTLHVHMGVGGYRYNVYIFTETSAVLVLHKKGSVVKLVITNYCHSPRSSGHVFNS